jgi:hypothetical protein
LRIVYRVQPAGLGIKGHRSELSGDPDVIGLDRGPHVFSSIAELANGVRGWFHDPAEPEQEVLAILAKEEDLEPNYDYEGEVLIGGRGRIVARRSFKNWQLLLRWVTSKEAQKWPNR